MHLIENSVKYFSIPIFKTIFFFWNKIIVLWHTVPTAPPCHRVPFGTPLLGGVEAIRYRKGNKHHAEFLHCRWQEELHAGCCMFTSWNGMVYTCFTFWVRIGRWDWKMLIEFWYLLSETFKGRSLFCSWFCSWNWVFSLIHWSEVKLKVNWVVAPIHTSFGRIVEILSGLFETTRFCYNFSQFGLTSKWKM